MNVIASPAGQQRSNLICGDMVFPSTALTVTLAIIFLLTMTDNAEEKNPKRRCLDGEKDTAQLDTKGIASKDLGSPGLPHLPPDLWALVMSFMPYSDNLTCSVLNKSFLNDVAPRIKMITVLDREELRFGDPASRFRGVEGASIACIFRDPDGYKRFQHNDGKSYEFSRWDDMVEGKELRPEVDAIAISRIVPFITNFPVLSKIVFGRLYIFDGIDRFDECWQKKCLVLMKWDVGYNKANICYYAGSKRNHSSMRSLEHVIGGAYASSLLSDAVLVYGLPLREGCYYIGDDNQWGNREQCPHCNFFFDTFPLREVIKQASSRCVGASGRVNSMLKRQGGRDLLTSRELILDTYLYPRFFEQLANECQKRGLVANISRKVFLECLSDDQNCLKFRSHYIQNALVALGVLLRKADLKSN